MPVERRLAEWGKRIETALDRALRPTGPAIDLNGAMRHAALGGGKRLRPLLVYATGHACGASEASLDAAAVAIELIHAFSLVHDDLPAMDNDELRRGKPTVHVVYGVAAAILAGDALQSMAFAVLAEAGNDPDVGMALVRELAQASGANGMCAGQALDMHATGQALDLRRLEQLHALKTGALIRAAVRMGAICARAPAAVTASLDRYADALGLAFQIRDDMLDTEGDSAQLGKTAGKDVAQGKSTYPALLGLEGSRQRLDALSLEMKTALEPLGSSADALHALGALSVTRLR